MSFLNEPCLVKVNLYKLILSLLLEHYSHHSHLFLSDKWAGYDFIVFLNCISFFALRFSQIQVWFTSEKTLAKMGVYVILIV
jgi:hypothetical protein